MIFYQSMHDQSLFVESGKIITEANRKVLGVELNVESARGYISNLVAADTILNKSPLPEVARAAQLSVDLGSLSIREWADNRCRGLIYLIEAVRRAATLDVGESSQASALCAIALAKEPLIPNLNSTEYAKTVRVSTLMIDRALSVQPRAAVLYSTYNLACLYNAEAFCPEIFEEEITPVIVSQSWSKFLIQLRNLQAGG